MSKEKARRAWAKVIEVFKELSYLYDKKHKDYFNRDIRHEAYKMLLQIYNEEVGEDTTTLAEFKRKFENMRTSYGRELKRVNASKQPGSGSSVYVPTLWYYSLFDFLEVATKPSLPGSNTLDERQNLRLRDFEDSSSDEKEHEEEVFAIPTITPAKKQKISLLKKQEMILNSAQALMAQKEEDWKIIGKSIGLQMRDLSEHQKVIVQKIISDAIFYGKLGKLTEESQIILSPEHIPQYPFNQGYNTCSSCSAMNNIPSPQHSPKFNVQSSDQSP